MHPMKFFDFSSLDFFIQHFNIPKSKAKWAMVELTVGEERFFHIGVRAGKTLCLNTYTGKFVSPAVLGNRSVKIHPARRIDGKDGEFRIVSLRKIYNGYRYTIVSNKEGFRNRYYLEWHLPSLEKEIIFP